MSEYHVISGDLALAINQLRLAQAVPNINSVQRERFDARIRELQEYLPKGRRAREVAEPQGPAPEPGSPG
jgi:predicted Zn-dependent protease